MSIPYHDSKHPFLRQTNTEEISIFDPKGKFNFLEIISDSSNIKFYRGLSQKVEFDRPGERSPE